MKSITVFIISLISFASTASVDLPKADIDISLTYLRLILDEYPDGQSPSEGVKSVQIKAKGIATLKAMEALNPELFNGSLPGCSEDRDCQALARFHKKLFDNYEFYMTDVNEYLKSNPEPEIDTEQTLTAKHESRTEKDASRSPLKSTHPICPRFNYSNK